MSAAEATRNGTPRRSSAKTARCSLRDHDAKGLGFDAGDEDAPLDGDASVSYTHLPLPTIYSV